ncbi:esterase-like activity of phytase family protein [uncultured Paracoccus sp.]|uniref:esterase-like activity of phytase family protein n=1 Tax=uncultured Paracoccus sp. TaxID=189685 RepID=UPI0026075777|nr:esterase-like activity of phytase family protein [uncultured Paracoccus sp.]
MPVPTVALPVDYVGTYVWDMPDADFGGFSGLHLSEDGQRFTALTDRVTLRWGSIQRDPQGRIRGLGVVGSARLRDSTGKVLPPGRIGDSEGLAIDDGGRIYVSYEGLVRIARYDTPDAAATRIDIMAAFRTLPPNAALEALAILPDGALLAIPEGRPVGAAAYPVFVQRDGVWTTPWTIPVLGPFAPVGADVGPDGRLYLLERDFKGVLGFASRVRRFDLNGVGLGPGEVVLQTSYRQYDNLEGISVWDDGQGIRLTMISDDNFVFLQRTELVEYRIRK